MFVLVRLVVLVRRVYGLPVRKRTKVIVQSIVGLVAALVVGLALLFLWLSREPTTELVDSTGQALSASGDLGEGRGTGERSPFDEARSFIEAGEFENAKANLMRLLADSDRDGEACILLSKVTRELKEIEAAVDYGLKAITLLPRSAEAHLSYAEAVGSQIFADMQSLGGMFSAMARLPAFKAELDRVIELDPDDVEARTMLVFFNLAPPPLGDVDYALEISGEIEARDPVRGKQLRAVCLNRKKETQSAIELLKAGIEEHPDETSFHLTLADIYSEEKRVEEADAAYELARSAEKDEIYYRSLYGQARMRVLNEYGHERALVLLDEFIAAEPRGKGVPSVGNACWRKGNVLEKLDRKTDARRCYEDALRREPGLQRAQTSLAALQE
jgi:tetratricopeptide (TPR) repeat protein